MLYLKDIFKNKIFGYLTTRYITYAIQFLNSIFIANNLGPFYLGIYGFITLILSYFQQFNLGIPNSFNILYVHHKDNDIERNSYIINSFILTGYLSLLVVISYIFYSFICMNIDQKYDIDKWSFWILVMAILHYLQTLIITIFRLKNKLGLVAICQSISVFLIFISALIFKGERLIGFIIISYIISYILCLILAIKTKIIPSSNYIVSFTLQKEILKKGIALFFYNSAFYFIIISERSIISSFYTISEFGYFTFSYTIANAIMLSIEALAFVVFPKLVDRLSIDCNDIVKMNISQYRLYYITSSNLLIYLAIIFFPYFLNFLPQYNDALRSAGLIALTILMSVNFSGYSELLLARNKERLAAYLAIFALLLNVILAIILVFVFRTKYDIVIVSTLITYLIYSLLIVYFGNKLLGINSIYEAVKICFPLRLMLPYVIAIYGCVTGSQLFTFLPLFMFVLLNYKYLKQIISFAFILLKKPNTVDL